MNSLSEELERALYWVASKPHPSVLLEMADSYIRLYNKMPEGEFVIPKAHKNLAVLVENFAHDLSGFVAFVKTVRDLLADTHPVEYSQCHELYRTLLTRKIQQERRARLDRAIAVLCSTHGKPSFEEQQKWRRVIEREWARQRLEYLEVTRHQLGGSISREVTIEVLDQFWNEIDQAIEAGDIPFNHP